jgi:hypothetical protein
MKTQISNRHRLSNLDIIKRHKIKHVHCLNKRKLKNFQILDTIQKLSNSNKI